MYIYNIVTVCVCVCVCVCTRVCVCEEGILFLSYNSFHDAMKRFTLVSRLRSLSTSTLPPHASLSSTQLLTPPHSLLDYPPLANLTNTLIQAFNDLRQCAPLALGPEISQELRRLLESIVHDVGEFHK